MKYVKSCAQNKYFIVLTLLSNTEKEYFVDLDFHLKTDSKECWEIGKPLFSDQLKHKEIILDIKKLIW